MVLSTRVCLIPVRGVMLARKGDALGGVAAASCCPGLRAPSGETPGCCCCCCFVAATLGVRGGRWPTRAAAALSWGWRALLSPPPGGIVREEMLRAAAMLVFLATEAVVLYAVVVAAAVVVVGGLSLVFSDGAF